METEFDITLTSLDMYRFSMYHTYTGMQGILSIIIAIMCFVAAVVTRGNVTDMYTALYAGFGVIFLLYMPFTLYLRAKRQFLMSKSLRSTLHYRIDEKGIHTTQNEASADLSWEQVYKVVSTKSNVLIYSSRIHAYIIPREQIIKQYETIRKIAGASLPAYRFKMK
ncbi:MAG: YcxB family protein [Lachnospiraceae bacterium]|nr:YcxB family protein [Lachnospiraceae bacterium]